MAQAICSSNTFPIFPSGELSRKRKFDHGENTSPPYISPARERKIKERLRHGQDYEDYRVSSSESESELASDEDDSRNGQDGDTELTRAKLLKNNKNDYQTTFPFTNWVKTPAPKPSSIPTSLKQNGGYDADRQAPRGYDTILLASVNEVLAKFQQEKWRFVAEAMMRRGGSWTSEDACRHRYEELMRTPSENTVAKILPQKSAEQSGNEIAGAAPQAEKATTSFIPGRKSPSDKVHPVEIGRAEPGSLPANAILLEESSTHSQTSSVPSEPTATMPVGSDSRSSLFPFLTEPPKLPEINKIKSFPSRINSATNRGPARLTSHHKSRVDNVNKKPKTALNTPSNDLGLDEKLDMLVENLAASSKEFRLNDPQKISETLSHRTGQSLDTPLQSPPHPNIHSQALLPVPAPSSQPIHKERSLHNELPNANPAGSAAPQRDSTAPISEQRKSFQQSAAIESTGTSSSPGDQNSTQPAVIDAKVGLARSPGRPKKSVSRKQVKDMIRHKFLNDFNSQKPWDVIAQECGVAATLADITQAFEEAGFIGMFQTASPSSDPANPASQKRSIGTNHPAPPITPVSSTESFVTANSPVAIAASQTPSRELETRAAPSNPQPESTPTSTTKRGPGRPRKDASITPPKPAPSSRGPPTKKTDLDRSEIMRAAWARRKARESKGDFNGPQESSPGDVSQNQSTGSKNTMSDSYAASFAAQVLAAAAAQESATPTPAPQGDANITTVKQEPRTHVESVDVLTGENMWAQHLRDTSSSAQPPQEQQQHSPGPRAKKIVRRSHNFNPS